MRWPPAKVPSVEVISLFTVIRTYTAAAVVGASANRAAPLMTQVTVCFCVDDPLLPGGRVGGGGELCAVAGGGQLLLPGQVGPLALVPVPPAVRLLEQHGGL